MKLPHDCLDPLTRALRLAQNGPEVVEALRDFDLAELLERSSVDLGLTREWWARPTTLAGLLRLRKHDLPRSERLAILRSARLAAVALHIPDVPRPGTKPDALKRWFRTVDFPIGPDVPIIRLGPAMIDLARQNPGLAVRSIAEVWRLPPGHGSNRPFTASSRQGPNEQVMATMARALQLLATYLTEGGIGHAAIAAADPPDDPLLAEGWAALLAELKPHQGTHLGQTYVPPDLICRAARGGRLRVESSEGTFELRLRRAPGQSITTGQVDPMVILPAIYEILDDWRFGGETAGAIDDAMGWAVDLASLRALVPPEEPGQRPPLGFRIRPTARGPSLVSVLVEPTRRGVKHRELKTHEDPHRHAVEPVDRDVLRLINRAWAARMTDSADEPVAEALAALVGHPRFFLSSKHREPTPIVRARLELHLRAQPKSWVQAIWRVGRQEWSTSALQQALLLPLCPTQPWAILQDPEGSSLSVSQLSHATMELIGLLGRLDDLIPPELADALLPRLFPIDEIDLHLDRALEGRRVAASPTPILRLRSLPEGLDVALRVAPAPDGRTFAPGLGPPALRGVDDEGRWTVVRNLDAERRLASARWQRLGLDRAPPFDLTTLPLPEAVPLLDALSTEDPRGPVAWAGPERRVSTATASALALRIRSRGRLLALGGTLRIADAEIPVGQVLDALRGGQRFVAIDEGRIVRLHEELAAELQRLADASWTDREGDDELSIVSAGALEAIELQGAQVQAPPAWAAQRERLARARAFDPEIPGDLRAELRPYQREGVRWLLRLGAWGLGGVLADDMGLGKTIQALAVLLARGADGPALVVAPTSMVGTWAREAARFAPRLAVQVHHGARRATELADLGADQVVLTSWGTLVQDAELLTSRRFATIVLDEAHAIKNPSTRRAQAARALDADFVVALTGTPVENHPGELWSILRVVAPGLLGSREAFEERFGRPILEDPTGPERDRLAALIRPFLLRRTKAQVATDLPPREEIVVDVTLDPEERRLYEGVRRAALAELPTADVGAIPILAALTRLRQAACHAGLIAEGFADSSKLRTVRRTLADLRESGHKALVFSQFVSLLDRLAPQLVAEGYRVGRLDGRTSRAAREEVVDAFQRGGLDILLLSLKAGGVGLTLTAASYVLHLDPWWNPAVQDQATDRAHRIGQDQPVTALHFVSTNTVEVGIRELQATKRELVDGLLEGTGAAAKLDADALLALLREGGET